MRSNRPWIVALAALGLSRSAWSDPLWIEPADFRPEPHLELTVELRSGDTWPGQQEVRNEQQLARLVVLDARGAHPITGSAGEAPLGRFSARTLGPALIVYESTALPRSVPAEEFASWANRRGLRWPESASEGESTITRVWPIQAISSCKALIHVGGFKAPPGGVDRAADLKFELIPESDPLHWRGSGRLSVQVRWRGAPLAGVTVRASARHSAAAAFEAVSDEAGRAVLELAASGVWRLSAAKLVHDPLHPARAWTAYETSLLFEIPDESTPR
jgi:hypothetical protein